MKIGQVAQVTGLSIRTIRFYEEHGVLPPHPRTESGYRIFDAGDLERLDFIKKPSGWGCRSSRSRTFSPSPTRARRPARTYASC